MYRHTQVARVPLAGSLLLAIGTSLIAMKQHSVALFGIPVLLLLAGFLFSSLTVQLRDGELQSHFRFNFWTKRVPLASVTGAEVTQSSAWEGWGIRITPRGMLYNVWGTKAVEVRLQSGERLRLGTDEPGALIKRGALLGLGTRMLSSAVLLLAGAELLELTLGASVGVMAIATVLGFVQSARTTRAITQVRPGSPPLALKLPNPGAKKIIQGGQLALTRDAVTGGIVGDSVGVIAQRGYTTTTAARGTLNCEWADLRVSRKHSCATPSVASRRRLMRARQALRRAAISGSWPLWMRKAAVYPTRSRSPMALGRVRM